MYQLKVGNLLLVYQLKVGNLLLVYQLKVGNFPLGFVYRVRVCFVMSSVDRLLSCQWLNLYA